MLDLLLEYESRNITFIDPRGDWPIVWRSARGSHIRDAEGKRYLDLTSAFGVANAGHANPAVVRAGRRQMGELLHAMGDVHPHPAKAALAARLSELTFERWTKTSAGNGPSLRGKTIFCSSGFEAVEAALKTAFLATGRSRVIAFEGAYHGLGYGALNATYRGHFRDPFRRQLAEFCDFAPFPSNARELNRTARRLGSLLKTGRVGAALTEPIQGRAGFRVPAAGFLPLLRNLCDEHRVPLILDEIFTGFGRTGTWFASEPSGVVPDLICLGKALTGGFPLSACVGKAALMDAAWPRSEGEAIHTSTFLGHPVGCAMALAQIGEITRLNLAERSQKIGARLAEKLSALKLPAGIQMEVVGRGLMLGLKFTDRTGPATGFVLELVRDYLERGFVSLAEGDASHVLAFLPPLNIAWTDLERAVAALQRLLSERSAAA